MPDSSGAAGAGMAIGGGVVGAVLSSEERRKAEAARQQALANYNAINVPSQEQQAVQLQKQQSAGTLNPQLQKLIQQDPSAYNQIATDPRLKTAQLQALSGLQGIAQAGGRTMQDQANENQMLGQSNQQEQANRGAIMQNMASRGMSGSGFDLAAQLAGQQGAATRASQQQTDINAQAQQHALSALQMGGQLSGQMQGQDYGQQAQRASANDLISRFNSQNAQSVNSSNTQSQNSAQASNLQNAQNISNANTGISNQQETTNKGLVQQNFNNQMTKANGQAAALNGVAAGNQSNAAATGATWAGVGQGAGQAFSAYSANQKKQKDANDEEAN